MENLPESSEARENLPDFSKEEKASVRDSKRREDSTNKTEDSDPSARSRSGTAEIARCHDGDAASSDGHDSNASDSESFTPDEIGWLAEGMRLQGLLHSPSGPFSTADGPATTGVESIERLAGQNSSTSGEQKSSVSDKPDSAEVSAPGEAHNLPGKMAEVCLSSFPELSVEAAGRCVDSLAVTCSSLYFSEECRKLRALWRDRVETELAKRILESREKLICVTSSV